MLLNNARTQSCSGYWNSQVICDPIEYTSHFEDFASTNSSRELDWSRRLVEVTLNKDHSVNYFLQTINIIIFAINPLVMIHKEVLWWRTDPILWWLVKTTIPFSMGGGP